MLSIGDIDEKVKPVLVAEGFVLIDFPTQIDCIASAARFSWNSEGAEETAFATPPR